MLHVWKNLPVAKKLYAVVGIMASLIAMELFTLFFAMNTLSAVRTFVDGESMWSKAQKNAVHSLYSYIFTKDDKYYNEFKSYLLIPLGDRIAHNEINKGTFDREIIAKGFLQGGVHPKDIPGAIDFVIRFHNVQHVKRALDAWNRGNVYIDQLINIADRLHIVLHNKGDTQHEIKKIMAEIDVINSELTRLETEFSTALGEGSRWLERLLMIVLVLAVLTVESAGLFLTILFS